MPASIAQQQNGGLGFDVIESGDGNVTPSQGESYVKLLAANGAATLGANTTSDVGDDPIDSHTIPDGEVLKGRFDQVDVSSGTVYAYPETRS